MRENIVVDKVNNFFKRYLQMVFLCDTISFEFKLKIGQSLNVTNN